MEITARGRIHNVRRTAATLDAPLPAGFVKQLDAALIDAAEAIKVPGAELNIAVLDAIADGRSYHDDALVQRLALDRQLAAQGIDMAARQRAEYLKDTALIAHADKIIDSWSEALEPHSVALTNAADVPADTDVTDADSAVARGGAALQAWAATQTAIQAWSAALVGFGALADAAHISYREQDVPLILTPATAAQLEPARRTAAEERVTLDAWILARHRLPLDLATLGEFTDRMARHDARLEAARLATTQARQARLVEHW